MQYEKNIQNKHYVKDEFETSFSQYLKEKKQLTQLSHNLRTIQNKNSISEFSRFISAPTSQLTTSLNLGQNSTKHSVGLSPKVEQSPYLKNNKSSIFHFFRNETISSKSQKSQDIFKSTIKMKTEGTDIGTPAYSPKKEPLKLENYQKQEQLKLPPINQKKNKNGSNLSLNLKQLLIESPYTKQIKKYETLFQKKILSKRNHNYGNTIDSSQKKELQKANQIQTEQKSEQSQEQAINETNHEEESKNIKHQDSQEQNQSQSNQ